MLRDDLFLGAESSFNLFVTKYRADDADEERRETLDTVAQWHCGEYVGIIKQGVHV
jgi:DNA damage-binding protein 1